MLAIIAHHYVVNSTATKLYDLGNPSLSQYFLQVWGMWGKTAINSFILISGYFLCKQRLTWQRYVKLLAQIYFYGFTIMFIFALSGYEPLTLKMVVLKTVGIFKGIGNGFTASFLAFYAFVPVYNKLINALSQKELRYFVLGLLFVTTICGTFCAAHSFLEPLWYATLYLIAAYIRCYPNKYTESRRFTATALAVSVILAVLSVVAIQWVGTHYFERGAGLYYYFVADSHKILALAVGLSAFLVAKNLPTFHSKIINWLSAGTFGVLLIHTSSDTMRRWLWQDVCRVPEMFQGELMPLVLQALAVPILIFAICTTIDYFRRQFLEKPFMNWLLARWPENK